MTHKSNFINIPREQAFKYTFIKKSLVYYRDKFKKQLARHELTSNYVARVIWQKSLIDSNAVV